MKYQHFVFCLFWIWKYNYLVSNWHWNNHFYIAVLYCCRPLKKDILISNFEFLFFDFSWFWCKKWKSSIIPTLVTRIPKKLTQHTDQKRLVKTSRKTISWSFHVVHNSTRNKKAIHLHRIILSFKISATTKSLHHLNIL